MEILERSSFHSEASENEEKNDVYRIKDSPKAAANAHIHVRFGDPATSSSARKTDAPVEEAVKKILLLLLLPLLTQFQKRNVNLSRQIPDQTYGHLKTTSAKNVDAIIDPTEIETVFSPEGSNKIEELQNMQVQNEEEFQVASNKQSKEISGDETPGDVLPDTKTTMLMPINTRSLFEPKDYAFIPVVNYYPVPVSIRKPRRSSETSSSHPLACTCS